MKKKSIKDTQHQKLSPVNEVLIDEHIDIPKQHQELVLERIKNARKNPQIMLNWKEASKTLKH